MAPTENESAEKIRKEILRLTADYFKLTHLPDLQKEFSSGDRIPYAGRVFDEKEMQNLVDSSLDFWLTAGRFAESFEKKFANKLGVNFCSLVNSGSSANLLAFMSLLSPELGNKRLRPGDEVITVAAGFPTTVAPIIQAGCIPVFIDLTIEDGTYNLDVNQLEKALSSKTRAVFAAHTLGNPFDIQTVSSFCNKHNLFLIEDNCDALGSTYDNQPTGTVGDLATSSFYPPHHMTMGEGGAVYSKDPQFKRIINSLRDWGRDCWCDPGTDNSCKNRFSGQYGTLPQGYDHKYIYSHLGYNLKVTDMQAAIGLAQLDKLDSFTSRRKENWKILREGLSNLEEFFILPEATRNSDPSWFGFLLTVRPETGIKRTQIVNYLENYGIQTRMLFAGNLTKQPCMEDIVEDPSRCRIAVELKNTDRIMNDTFWIGVFPGMQNTMLEFMIDKISEAVQL